MWPDSPFQGLHSMLMSVHLLLHACMRCIWLLDTCMQVLNTPDDLSTQLVYVDGTQQDTGLQGARLRRRLTLTAPWTATARSATSSHLTEQ